MSPTATRGWLGRLPGQKEAKNSLRGAIGVAYSKANDNSLTRRYSKEQGVHLRIGNFYVAS
jgi:hypothetical protein